MPASTPSVSVPAHFVPGVMGVVMDDIAEISPAKDTTLGLLEAAQRRGWRLVYLEPGSLYLRDGNVRGNGRSLSVTLRNADWFQFTGAECDMPLDTLLVILMRVDPPVDIEFLNTCHLLQAASRNGVMVVNNPDSLQRINEKASVQQFAHLSPPTIISRCQPRLADFVREHGDAVIKPLNQMGGIGIKRIRASDPTVINTLNSATDGGKRSIVVQQTIKKYAQGDKRILIINGEPVKKALLRIPPPGKFCANLAAGGHGKGINLNERDEKICRCIRPLLTEMGLLFVGIDVIDGYLTEINVTSPTGMRELNRLYAMDIGNDVIAAIERRLDR